MYIDKCRESQVSNWLHLQVEQIFKRLYNFTLLSGFIERWQLNYRHAVIFIFFLDKKPVLSH